MDSARIALKEDGPLPFLVAAPPAAAAPMLVFLHGHDEGAPCEPREGLTRHGPFRSGNPVRTLDQFIVVAPRLPTRGDVWHRYADAVRTIVEAVRDEHRADRDRLYLTGFSFGGNGVFDLALLQPHLWAALWAVDPTRVPARDPGRPVWLSMGEVSRRGAQRFIDALDLEPPDENGERVFLDEGEDHVGTATRAYRDGRIYSWLLARRLA
jgi:dienelactone hydrolase